MAAYTYEPLAPGHIRLLSFSDPEDGQLVASIKQVRFDKEDPPVFSALSYVWGSVGATVPMRCDGAIIYITPTLDEAIRQITKLEEQTPVWIDQICINQKDLQERSEQVRKMNNIFKCATRVLAYLGPSTPSTALAVDLITRVGTIARGMSGDMFLWDSEQYHIESLQTQEEVTAEESEKLGIPFSDTLSWDAFSEFYDRPWYERIWIVQEMLPSRNGLVLCGTYSVPWELVKGAASWYLYKAALVSERHHRSVDGIRFTAGMEMSWNIRMGSEYYASLFGQKTAPTYRWELQRLLSNFRPRKATDPRDKVYALLGLSDLDIEDKGGIFEVDYSQSVKRVFTYTARTIIKSNHRLHGSNLDVLLQARRSTCTCEVDSALAAGEDKDDWPSWVPDWRRHFGTGCNWGVGQHIEAWHDAQAAGTHVEDEEGEIARESDPFALRARGTIVGRVVYASPYRHVSEIVMHGHMREARDKFVGMVSDYPAGGDDAESAFAMTMVGGELPASIVEKGTTVKEFADTYLGWVDCLMMPQETREEAKVRYQQALQYRKWGYDGDWVQAVLKAYCERRWYVLDTGHVGLGNHHMQEGDVVAKVVGLSVPCVLRPLGDGAGYRFIGEAYCHGEMWAADKPGTEPDQDAVVGAESIVIR